MDVGQPIIASLEPISQPLVVNPQQMQQRGIQIVHMDRIAGNIESQFIGFAVDVSCLDATPGQPYRIGPIVMIPAVAGSFALHHRCASEFPTPNDKCVVEKTLLLEILHEGCTCLLGI